MSKVLRKCFFLFWPPYEAHFARKFIDANISECPKKRLERIQKEIRKSIPQDINLGKAESLAKCVFESETKRKETIENKALAFMFAFSVCVSVILVLPTLFGETWNIPRDAAMASAGFYSLAVIHLFLAVYYAIQARRVSGFALPNADESVKAVEENMLTESDFIVMYISQAKFNEPILTKKANSLAVAEKMFIRGLLFLAVATCIAVIARVFIC